MKKNPVFVGLLVITLFAIGMVFFNKTKVKTPESIKKEKITVTPTSKAEIKTNVSPTNKPTTVSNDAIDAKLKEIDADVNNIDDSFSDTAVDVMAE